MNLLNRYFAPFASLLILSAVYFSEPDRKTVVLSIGVLAVAIAVNGWFAKNTYHFVGWAGRLRTLQIWLNYVWTLPLFYLLHGFWAPMWLLFVMAPVTAALYQGRLQTFATSMTSGGTMLALYWIRARSNGLELGGVVWGMAVVHAAFIVVFSLFIHALAETALRLRDVSNR
ncbi:MAG: hypothetical protein HY551_00790 [Elusimicrobia bacterium]|nr:hypothetical protein [Elusimicrobiota bacterium]